MTTVIIIAPVPAPPVPAIDKLLFPPDQIGYGISTGNDFLRSINEGARGKYGRTFFNNSNVATCTWICTEAEYDYLKGFYKAHKYYKFQIDLLLDEITQLTEYIGQFVPGSFTLASVAGLTFTVTAKIEIKPIKYDAANLPFGVDPGLTNIRFTVGTLYLEIEGRDSERGFSYHSYISESGSLAIIGYDVVDPSIGYFILAAGGNFEITGYDITNPVSTGDFRSREGGDRRLREGGDYRILES